MSSIEGAGTARKVVSYPRRSFVPPTLKVKLVDPDAKEPTRAHDGDAGLDLCSLDHWIIESGDTVKVRTGIGVEIPYGYVGLLFIRSGIASKRGLELANSVGVIDAHYRGEIVAVIRNDSGEMQHIGKGERVVQLVVSPIILPEVEIVDDLETTERGEGGFGSTGQH